MGAMSFVFEQMRIAQLITKRLGEQEAKPLEAGDRAGCPGVLVIEIPFQSGQPAWDDVQKAICDSYEEAGYEFVRHGSADLPLSLVVRNAKFEVNPIFTITPDRLLLSTIWRNDSI